MRDFSLLANTPFVNSPPTLGDTTTLLLAAGFKKPTNAPHNPSRLVMQIIIQDPHQYQYDSSLHSANVFAEIRVRYEYQIQPRLRLHLLD